MAKLLWKWKPRFAVALVVRDLLIVTSHTNCDVTSGPVVMRPYANADGDEQWYKMTKTQVSLIFKNCDRGRIGIDHLYGLRCRGWYCNLEQHSLCRPARPQAAALRPAQLVLFRIAVPTTPAQTVSWSNPIINLVWTMQAGDVDIWRNRGNLSGNHLIGSKPLNKSLPPMPVTVCVFVCLFHY